jgi:hypothetical protein
MNNRLTPAAVRELSGDNLRRAFELVCCGDDLTANTEERIVDALVLSGKRLRGVFTKWRIREGRRYQSEWESIVAAWRATPPQRTVAELLRIEMDGDSLAVCQNHPTLSDISGGRFNAWWLEDAANSGCIAATGVTPEEALQKALVIRQLEREA